MRYAIAAAVVLCFMLGEALIPMRTAARHGRWFANLSLFFFAAVADLLIPFGLVPTATWAQRHGVGLLNLLHPDTRMASPLAFLALDAVLYAQHRLMHAAGALWRLHCVHHSDLDCDVTTALRFHPLELPVTLAILCAGTLAIGPAPSVVALFAGAKVLASLFEHANLRLPDRLDGALRLLFVTPALHRVHHSVEPGESNRNYATILSIWDRLFGSYCGNPSTSPGTMPIGLAEFRAPRDQALTGLLLLPLRAPGASSAAGDQSRASPSGTVSPRNSSRRSRGRAVGTLRS